MLPTTPKAIVRAARRICAKHGTEELCRAAWLRVSTEIGAQSKAAGHRPAHVRELFDTARLTMLKAIVAGEDLDQAEREALRSIGL